MTAAADLSRDTAPAEERSAPPANARTKGGRTSGQSARGAAVTRRGRRPRRPCPRRKTRPRRAAPFDPAQGAPSNVEGRRPTWASLRAAASDALGLYPQGQRHRHHQPSSAWSRNVPGKYARCLAASGDGFASTVSVVLPPTDLRSDAAMVVVPLSHEVAHSTSRSSYFGARLVFREAASKSLTVRILAENV